jgi:hypothetical protein
MDLISEEEAIRLCNSHSGYTVYKGITVTPLWERVLQQSKKRIIPKKKSATLFNKTGANFIVQAMINQHSTLAALCPDVVNTMRVITVFLDGRVTLTPLRITNRLRWAGMDFQILRLLLCKYLCGWGY